MQILLPLPVLLVAFVVHLPARTSYLVNWDSVQFALATEGFDLAAHRPHPPGYIGYIAVGWVLNLATGDANTSLVMVSMVAAALAPALLVLLGMQMMSARRALAVGLLFATSPLLWYYSGVALTYAAEAALATAFALLAWRARRGGYGWLVAASVCLALTAAVRQTGGLLLLPLWVWAAWPRPWTSRLYALGILGLTSLLWLVPLLWLSGGLSSYLEESAALGEVSSGQTSILSAHSAGMARNWAMLLVSLLAVAGAALIFLRPTGFRLSSAFSQRSVFLALWILPAASLFSLVHIGQPGYVLLIAPALFLGLVMATPAPMFQRPWRLAAVLGAAVGANLILIAWVPAAIYSALPPGAAQGYFRQYVASASDNRWAALDEFVSRFDPDSTALLSAPGGPRTDAAFRHAGYYLPEFRTFAVGFDHEGRFGVLYYSEHGHDNYTITRAHVAEVLPLRGTVTQVIVLDGAIAELVQPAVRLREYRLSDGSPIWVGEIPQPGAELAFATRPGVGPVIAIQRRHVIDPGTGSWLRPPEAVRLPACAVPARPEPGSCQLPERPDPGCPAVCS